DEAEGGELGHQLPVQGGLEVEVEVGQRLVDGVAGVAQPSALAPRPGLLDLQLEQVLEDLGGREPVAQGTVQLGAQLLGGGGQAQVSEVRAQALIGGRLGARRHPAATSYSARSRTSTWSPAAR